MASIGDAPSFRCGYTMRTQEMQDSCLLSGDAAFMPDLAGREKAAATFRGRNGLDMSAWVRQLDTRSPFFRGLIGPVRTQLRPASFAASSACSASCTIVSTLNCPWCTVDTPMLTVATTCVCCHV